ncbi:MAG: Rrf2 family transcriptional regulator [Opitutaceae bacterium]|nr:Rrf2 family transcriptional regulator [Opitutaceae bacterium]
MIRFGKASQTAISALSLLAEVDDGGTTRLSSSEISARRRLPRPIVAKVLTIASTLGLVDGTRGPGGGYWLRRRPQDITLLDIVQEFERSDRQVLCPFGPDWCGKGAPCPLHKKFESMDTDWMHYLRTTTLAVFVRAPLPPAAPKRRSA